MKNISLRNTIMTDNYDLNIWDRRGYETEYAEEGWAIDIYAYKHVQDPYGSGNHYFSISPQRLLEVTNGKPGPRSRQYL